MIKVWTNNNCVQCERTKKFLNDSNIEYVEISLLDNMENAKRFVEMGFRSAPIVETDSDIWSGFKLDKLKELVKGETE